MRHAHFIVAAVLLSASASHATPSMARVQQISVSRSELRVGDVIADLEPEAAAFDLGPAPAASGSRLIERDEIIRAFRDHGAEPPRVVPAAVRVIRKMRHMDAREIGDLVRAGLSETMPRGATLTDVRAIPSSVPEGWTRATCDVPRPPHKIGPLTSSASLTFYENEQALWRIRVQVELSLDQDAKLFDVARGSRVTLVIRRGLVEVGAAGTAGSDADVGDLVPVILSPSGRTISARLEDRDHAVAVGAP